MVERLRAVKRQITPNPMFKLITSMQLYGEVTHVRSAISKRMQFNEMPT